MFLIYLQVGSNIYSERDGKFESAGLV